MKSQTSAGPTIGALSAVKVLDQAAIKVLCTRGDLVELTLGQTVEEWDENVVYILVSGSVRLLLDKARTEYDASTVLVLNVPGQLFGSTIYLNHLFDCVIARASERSQLVKINKEELKSVLTARDDLSSSVLTWEQTLASQIALKQTPRWRNLDHRSLLTFLGKGTLVSVGPGEECNIDTPKSPSVGIVTLGSLKVIGEDGSEHILKVGDTFAIPFVENTPPKASSDGCFVALIIDRELATAVEPVDKFKSNDFSPTDGATFAKPVEKDDTYEENGITWLRRRLHLYPLVLQQSVMDCGVACLSMVSSFYGRKIGMNRLRELAHVTSQGTDLKSMADTAESIGFLARGIKANYDGLKKCKGPLICHWGSNHFVVLFEINNDEALIADPADDLITLSRDRFLQRYSGYALELVPTPRLSITDKGRSSFSRYASLLLSHKRTLIDVGVASLFIQVLMLATPLFTQVIVDKVLIHQSMSMLNILLIGMVLLTLFETAIATLRSYFIAFTAMKLDQSLFVQFYKHVLSLPLSFFEERTQGDIMTRFAENRKIQELLSGSTVTTLVDVFMAIVYLAIIFVYSFWFGLFTAVYILLFALIAVAVAPILRTIRRRSFQKNVASNSYLMETLRAIERIKSAASENRTRWAWEERFVESLDVDFKGTLISRGTQLVSDLVHLSGNILLLWFGAHLVIQGTITIGQLMAMNLMVARITEPILRVVDIWDDLQDLVVALERLNDVLDQRPEEENRETKLVLGEVSGKIRYENVTFRYGGNVSTNALQNVSFTVEPGQLVGIVGRSGCGKSTLLKLMQALHLPTSGRIFVDDHDITNLSLASLRRQIGVVAQHEYLFRGTIRETISYHHPDAPVEDVVKAAKMAGIHDFIVSLPRGYDYELTEGGGNLSGGQRQRLAIARAILHSPKIILFDEATSFLDSESERTIQNSLVNLRKNRTMIVVAHRLSTIRDADLILVMDRGQIVEVGNHSRLIENRGLYFYLSKQQTIE